MGDLTDTELAAAERVRVVVRELAAVLLIERKLYIVKPQQSTMGEIALEAYGHGKACDAVALQGEDLQEVLAELADRVERALNPPAAQTASADVRAVVLEELFAESEWPHAKGSGYTHRLASAIADRVAAQLTAPPPGHVCRVPCRFAPEDLDEIEAARNFVARHGGFDETINRLDKILAMHRAPTGAAS